jgi:hypothetical protein
MTDDWTDGNLDRNPDIMSDKTKCTNERCVIRHGCHRWSMPVDPIWQWYAKYEPYHTGDYYKCDHHIPVHRNNPFTDREQDPIVNAIPSNSRELE